MQLTLFKLPTTFCQLVCCVPCSFPPIALKWAAALLRQCDEPQHGIDLLGRDHFLLGKLLVTLGAPPSLLATALPLLWRGKAGREESCDKCPLAR